jgi:polyisoprenoid-binding protein YceI
MKSPTDLRPHPVPAPPAGATSAVPHLRRGGRRWRWAVLAVGLVVAAAGAGLWWFVLRQSAPPPATLDQAIAGVGAAGGSGWAATVDGTWSVDRTITNGEGTGSYTGFRVNEVLSGLGSATAVGRTSGVEGTLTVKGTTLEAATITARLTDITSDDSRRDGAIQRALDTSRFPTATFVLTQPVDVASVPTEGERITASASGDLTIHGVTRQVTLALQAQLQNGVLVVVGSTEVSFDDFGVTAPTAPIVAGVDDHGVVEVQLYFTKS